MKLQRQIAYNYKGKNHYKKVIVIRNNVILKLGWKYGQELKSEVRSNLLVMRSLREIGEKKM